MNEPKYFINFSISCHLLGSPTQSSNFIITEPNDQIKERTSLFLPFVRSTFKLDGD